MIDLTTEEANPEFAKDSNKLTTTSSRSRSLASSSVCCSLTTRALLSRSSLLLNFREMRLWTLLNKFSITDAAVLNKDSYNEQSLIKSSITVVTKPDLSKASNKVVMSNAPDFKTATIVFTTIGSKLGEVAKYLIILGANPVLFKARKTSVTISYSLLSK